MAVIRPFRSLLYQSKKVGDLSRVVAFPPDPFVKRAPEEPGQLSPYQIRHVLRLVEQERADEIKIAKFQFASWLNNGVIAPDDREGLYVAEESFVLNGRRYRRTVLYAMVETQSRQDAETIIPHERTDPKRLERFGMLLKAYGAQVSPIFALYEDPKGQARRLLNGSDRTLVQSFKFAHERLDQPMACRVYRVDAPGQVKRILSSFLRRQIFIADGHHRYEAALHIGAPAVLMGLSAIEDPGLIVLPIHRLIKVPAAHQEGFLRRIRAEFRTRMLAKAPEGRRTQKDIVLVSASKFERLKVGPNSGGVVGGLLSLQHVLEGSEVAFAVEADNVKEQIARGTFTHGFLVPALNVKDIIEVVRRRGVLPVKSSYFFPKLFSGLIMASSMEGSFK